MVKRPLNSWSKLPSTLIYLIILFFVTGCNDKEAPIPKLGALKSQEAAPDFELTGIDSKVYHLTDFKGQVVLLNFWATWCRPCVLEMPSLERLHQALKNKGFKVVSINMDAPGSDATVKKFSESYGLNFTVLRDPNYSAADKYGVTGFPETFIINREGKLISFNDPYTNTEGVRIISDRPWDSGNYLKAIESLL